MAAVHPYRTAEARWFFRGAVPAPVRAWFDALGEPVETEARTDHYLAPSGDGLGVKVREGRLEAKRRDGAGGRLRVGRAASDVASWSKWSFALAEGAEPVGPWVEVAKRRRQRERAAAGGACALELAEVAVGGEAWWSVCLEATGPTEGARRAALVEAAGRWLGRDDAPALPAEAALGYPAWLLARGASDGPTGAP